MNFLAAIGRTFLTFLAAIGAIALFTVNGLVQCVRPPFYPRLFGRQIVDIGYYSLPVVGLTALFTGMVLALQAQAGFSRFGAGGFGASVVLLSVVRELGPVLAGLMVAGRIGASMAAEIGTMRVTEQIDALSTLSTNPYKYLVAPRLVAGILMVPCLVIVADIIGVFGGFLISVYRLGANPSAYMVSTWQALQVEDVVLSLIKAAVFGFVVALMGSYHGYNSRGGAQGVGGATTNAVVSSSILILLLDFVITGLFV
jgi:phospholipid/cholesterol/gamma-HCH transport system permease protein